MREIASSILMIRPAGFGYNVETAMTNAYQKKPQSVTREQILNLAISEFDTFAELLRSHGIEIIAIQDTEFPVKPDAVFPNNWISTDAEGNITLFPMQPESRRCERRADIVEELRKRFDVHGITDLSFYEKQNRFLEGTGSMVIDHGSNVIYACVSPRTDSGLLKEFSSLSKSSDVVFDAFDANGERIYHTNVMLCIGKGFAVICDEVIRDEGERNYVLNNLSKTNHEIISISEKQMNEFAGNMLMLENAEGSKFIVMSLRAFRSLSGNQIRVLSRYGELIKADIPNIETIGGGSARCMIAEIFLPKK